MGRAGGVPAAEIMSAGRTVVPANGFAASVDKRAFAMGVNHLRAEQACGHGA
jgi:hypothetical protein